MNTVENVKFALRPALPATAAEAVSVPMHAVLHRQYGTPDVLSDFRRVLSPTGTYVSCGGGKSSLRWLIRLAKVSVTSLFTRQKLKTFIVSPNRADLLALKDLVEAGKAKPFIERRYALNEVAEALRHVGQGHTRGQVVIQIAG